MEITMRSVLSRIGSLGFFPNKEDWAFHPGEGKDDRWMTISGSAAKDLLGHKEGRYAIQRGEKILAELRPVGRAK